MKVSLNWAKSCSNVELAPNGIDELVEKIGAQLGAVEEVIDLGAKYKGAVIARVIKCEQHPNADRLHICTIDDGGITPTVKRDESGHVQVVCGAPNVREGLMVAWLPPGVTVPATVDKDPFVLEAREIRGQVSNGMLASPKELALGDGHEGILEIDEDAKPGQAFAEVYGLNDYIIDIENKMFTHRPDCFGQLGVAREIAGIYGKQFISPAMYKAPKTTGEYTDDSLGLEVRNEIPEVVPRFMAQVFENVKVGPSSLWMQTYLLRVGLRPINNVVDITNYFMLLTGQPLHAYDYDKVKAQDPDASVATLVVRYPHDGEKLQLLNGKEVEPRAEAIIIATNTKAIGLGGVMGGADTEVDEHTKNIILECGTFDMYSIRRTSMAHGLFTDAVTRFNKSQSPLQNDRVLAWAGDELVRTAEAVPVKNSMDVRSPALDETFKRDSLYPPVPVSAKFINDRLGLTLSAEDMKTLLANVEFTIEMSGEDLIVKAPFCRTDIETREDVVEEVGRLYGYDKLPLELPKRDLTPAPKDPGLELKAKIRNVLSKAGANEVLTYSFVHGNLLDKVGQDKAQAYELSNALSPDLQYYRLSLTPSLLEKIHPNIKAGYDQFALFELGKVHSKSELDQDRLPIEFDRLALTFAASDKAAQDFGGAPYYEARKYLLAILHEWGLEDEVSFIGLSNYDFGNHELSKQLAAAFEPGRSAVIVRNDEMVGIMGEYRGSVQKRLKLPAFSAGFELFLSALQNSLSSPYVPLPRFPKVEQDICFKVSADMPYQELYDFVQDELTKVQGARSLVSLSPVDIYQRGDDHDHKQITLRLSIASYEKTMRDTEVNAMLNAVAAAAQQKFSAERV